MKEIEIVCPDCKTINKVEVDLTNESLLGMSTICDNCQLDVYFDVEIDLVVTPYRLW